MWRQWSVADLLKDLVRAAVVASARDPRLAHQFTSAEQFDSPSVGRATRLRSADVFRKVRSFLVSRSQNIDLRAIVRAFPGSPPGRAQQRSGHGSHL